LLVGALKKAATAFIVDIVLTSPFLKTAIGINPFLGAAITASVTGILSGIVSGLLDPVLSSPTSFASCGRIDSPMLALVGDASRLSGSSDREWILRDDQLWKSVAEATAAQPRMLMTKLDEVTAAINATKIVGVLKGNDIYLVSKGVETQNAMR